MPAEVVRRCKRCDSPVLRTTGHRLEAVGTVEIYYGGDGLLMIRISCAYCRNRRERTVAVEELLPAVPLRDCCGR